MTTTTTGRPTVDTISTSVDYTEQDHSADRLEPEGKRRQKDSSSRWPRGSTGSPFEALKPDMIVVGVSLGVIILVTFVGNVLVCLSVIKVRKLRHPSNYLLMSLAISDLCVACVVMPFGLYQSIESRWQLGRLLCNVYVVSDVTSCTASILNLCIISIDRYLAITRPLTYCVKRTTRLMMILIGIVWICACLISGKANSRLCLHHLRYHQTNNPIYPN